MSALETLRGAVESKHTLPWVLEQSLFEDPDPRLALRRAWSRETRIFAIQKLVRLLAVRLGGDWIAFRKACSAKRACSNPSHANGVCQDCCDQIRRRVPPPTWEEIAKAAS